MEPKEEIPSICTFRGLKPEVFKRAHKKAKEAEASGKVLMTDDWKRIVRQSWKEIKEEAKKICPCNQLIDEKSNEELVSNKRLEDMLEGLHKPEEEPMKEEQSVEKLEQDEELVDVASEQTSIEEKTQGVLTEEKLDE